MSSVSSMGYSPQVAPWAILWHICSLKAGLLLFVVFFGLILHAEDAPQTDLKLKVRWIEKKVKPGSPRVVTVYVKNEGMKDIESKAAEINVVGKGKDEKQVAQVRLDIAHNQEKAFDLQLVDKNAFVPVGLGNAMPIQQVLSANVVIGKDIFSSP